jgi:hypothetical protein
LRESVTASPDIDWIVVASHHDGVAQIACEQLVPDSTVRLWLDKGLQDSLW